VLKKFLKTELKKIGLRAKKSKATVGDAIIASSLIGAVAGNETRKRKNKKFIGPRETFIQELKRELKKTKMEYIKE
tara:strand:+ start:158 stop:385 length:228 start_codon:yes stop_codon:yes gene_type:complete